MSNPTKVIWLHEPKSCCISQNNGVDVEVKSCGCFMCEEALKKNTTQ